MRCSVLVLVMMAACGSSAQPHLQGDAALGDGPAAADANGDAAPDAPVDAAPSPIDAPPDAAPDAAVDAGMPMLTASTTSIVIDPADIGQQTTASIEITNTGTASALVKGTIAGPRQIYMGLDTCVADPGSSCTLIVAFTSYAAGVFNAQLTMTSGAWTAQASVAGQTYTALYLAKWGNGHVDSTTQSITCASAGCDVRYTGQVTLRAVPDPGNVFVAWSDPVCGSSTDCVFAPDAAGRALRAYFAPTASTTSLGITIAGDATGVVLVEDLTFSTHEIAACRSSCTVPVPIGAHLRITEQSLSTVVPFTGTVCTGQTRCPYTATTSPDSVTATFQRGPTEAWTREMKTTPIVSGAYDSQGNLVVVTNAFSGADEKVIKLDAMGQTVWAHPLRPGSEVRIGRSDTIYVRNGADVWLLDAEGYLLGYAHSFAAIDTNSGYDPAHFQRRMVVTPGIIAGVGNTTGLTVEGSPMTAATWDASVSVVSLHDLEATATTLFAAVANAAGGTDLVTYNYSGMQLASITDAAPHQHTAVRVVGNGDIVTASATNSQVSVRRISGGSAVFTHDTAIAYSAPPNVGLAATTGDRAFVVYSASTPLSGGVVGYNAEVVGTTGAVDWSVSRPAVAGTAGGAEVYDVTSNATDVALTGAYLCISPDFGGATTADVVYGAGFVQTFKP